MTDNSGNVQSEYSFDPYGRQTKIQELNPSDFQYAGYYFHTRSGLNFTRTRAYSAAMGRWISRDPIGEQGDINIFSYVQNRPIGLADPTGLKLKGGVQFGPPGSIPSDTPPGNVCPIKPPTKPPCINDNNYLSFPGESCTLNRNESCTPNRCKVASLQRDKFLVGRDQSNINYSIY